jgi:diguanylate cyclase (GGDEF)-like protein
MTAMTSDRSHSASRTTTPIRLPQAAGDDPRRAQAVRASLSPARLIRSGYGIRLIGLAMLICTVVVVVAAIEYMRKQSEDAYRREISSLDTVLAEQTFRYIQEIDLVLIELRDRASVLHITSPDDFRRIMGSRDMHAVLQGHVQNMAQVDALNIVDADGQSLNSSRDLPVASIDDSDRDYFRHFAEQDDSALFISAPLMSRVTGQLTLFIARRVNSTDGQFLGVVVGVIDVSYLTSFYEAIDQQPGRTFTLMRRDGLVLVRDPDTSHSSGTTMPSDSPWYDRVREGGGTYTSSEYSGGISALVTVHPLRGYPLVFDISFQTAIALAAWRHQAMLLTLAGLVAGIGFAVLFWHIGRLFHRQSEQNRTLHQISTDLETTLDNMDQGLMVIAKDRSVPICNRRALELLDLPSEMMAACPQWEDVLAYQWGINEFANSNQEFQEFVQSTALMEGPLVYDRVRPNGRVLEVRTAPLPGGEAVRTYTDITERKRAEQRIEFLAHHDGLTGLANRVLLDDRLTQALAHAKRGNKQVAVLALDLDHFKDVNDSLGHAAGDSILIQAAERLLSVVRAGDTVARVGGDEFVIVHTDAAQPQGAVEVARRVIEAMSQPLEFAGQPVQIGTSVGIAIYPADGDAASSLLKFADIALYRAKADGGGAFRLFEQGMDLRLRDRHELEQDLRRAIGSDQLTLVYQPQIASASGKVTGFEALLRWRHPVRGPIPPSVFIPIAEESRLIGELGAWTLERACSAARGWPEEIRVAVNLSAAQFQNSRLPDQVAEILHRTGLPAARLELEVTETLLIDDPQETHSALSKLKEMGVRIALDDFGSGYSSLSYLHRYPFDRVKIDQSFIQSLGNDPSARSIVHTIIGMARTLNLDVVAEGIETEQQLSILQSQQCAEVQGFLLGRPMAVDGIGQFLSSNSCRETAARVMASVE